MKKQYKLSKAATRLFDQFDEAAQRWGWTEDQGVGTEVATAEKDYLEAKVALLLFIAKLQSKIREQA